MTGESRPAQPRATAGDADRERLLAQLREHYALGHIDDSELDRRTEIVLTAQFTDQAATAVAGLPLLSGAAPGSKRHGRRYAEADQPGAGWVPTSERFRDPASRLIMRVWIDPVDDSRHYVPDQEG
jgi:hypothetical protein